MASTALGEVARLEASSASAERTRLGGLAQASAALSSLLVAADEELKIDALDQAEEMLQRAQALREAAAVAASANFSDELPGVAAQPGERCGRPPESQRAGMLVVVCTTPIAACSTSPSIRAAITTIESVYLIAVPPASSSMHAILSAEMVAPS